MAARDDFNAATIELLRQRVGYLCSNPTCRRATVGPAAGDEQVVRIGVAAHITAAAQGGPRFDSSLSQDERAGYENGIWLCQTCSRQVDSDADGHSVETLKAWKHSAETHAAERFSTPERPESRSEPLLTLPAAHTSDSWLLYSSRSVPFVGREAELTALKSFLSAEPRFLWQLVCGPGGSGKSRLALELCLQSQSVWKSGFLAREQALPDWDRYRPTAPTLIVVDYVRSRLADISAMALRLARSMPHLPHPIRLLLLERHSGDWLSQFSRLESLTESTLIEQSRHGDTLDLEPLAEETLELLGQAVAKSRELKWSPETAKRFRVLVSSTTIDIPLFAMLAADQLLSDASHESPIGADLLRLVLRKERARRRTLVADGRVLRLEENLLMLATLLGGLEPRKGGFRYLDAVPPDEHLPPVGHIDVQRHNEFAGVASSGTTLAALQPDLLGERYVLDCLNDAFTDPDAARAVTSFGWDFAPDRFCDFIVRAATDFPDDSNLLKLIPLPASEAAYPRWARLVGELIDATGRDTGVVVEAVLNELRVNLAPSTRNDQTELRGAIAGAEFSLANAMFNRGRPPHLVLAQFDKAIELAPASSPAASAARNNRAILYSQTHKRDLAFDEWSAIADGPDRAIDDETRACALNNRADILAGKGMHEAAISDRSRVLQLASTSFNRRFIALFRRSMSRAALGRRAEACDDLAAILGTPDISDAQKASARIERASHLILLGNLTDASRDLEMALASSSLFRGAEAEALVGLADVAALESDNERAEDYLELASRQAEAEPGTTMRVLLVRAQLSRNSGETALADEICRKLLERARPQGYLHERASSQLNGSSGSRVERAMWRA